MGAKPEGTSLPLLSTLATRDTSVDILGYRDTSVNPQWAGPERVGRREGRHLVYQSVVTDYQ